MRKRWGFFMFALFCLTFDLKISHPWLCPFLFSKCKSRSVVISFRGFGKDRECFYPGLVEEGMNGFISSF